jgi:hypothetical protein
MVLVTDGRIVRDVVARIMELEVRAELVIDGEIYPNVLAALSAQALGSRRFQPYWHRNGVDVVIRRLGD